MPDFSFSFSTRQTKDVDQPIVFIVVFPHIDLLYIPHAILHINCEGDVCVRNRRNLIEAKRKQKK